MKTFTATPATIKHEWCVVDATDKILGRLATELAHRLRGKHKPEFTPNMDMGDHMVVVNAEKIKVTGKKLEDKMYYRHTGYIGNLKSINLGKLLDTHPERALQYAVKGMLPKNPLGRAMYRKLHVYAGPEHPHQAQQPTQLEL
jgi:large subunit ribosomal protein L13